jgi:hypothetical protein
MVFLIYARFLKCQINRRAMTISRQFPKSITLMMVLYLYLWTVLVRPTEPTSSIISVRDMHSLIADL